jgi:hypothetical protein
MFEFIEDLKAYHFQSTFSFYFFKLKQKTIIVLIFAQYQNRFDRVYHSKQT